MLSRHVGGYLLSLIVLSVGAYVALGRPADRLDQFIDQLQRAPKGQKEAVYKSIRGDLQAMEPDVPGLSLVNKTIQARLDCAGPIRVVQVGLRTGVEGAAQLISAQNRILGCGPEAPEKLYELAERVEVFAKLGVSIAELSHGDPDLSEALEKAAKLTMAGLTMEQLREKGEIDWKRFVYDITRTIPRELAPALRSPAVIFFRDLHGWNQKGWDLTTEGLDLVARGIQSGGLDEQAYQRVSENLKTWAREGPWNLKSGTDFIKKITEDLPKVGGIMKFFWKTGETESTLKPPPRTVADAIDCDCSHVDAGLLTRAYIEQCQREEKRLKGLASANNFHVTVGPNGTLVGGDFCDPTASGPSPWPTQGSPANPPSKKGGRPCVYVGGLRQYDCPSR